MKNFKKLIFLAMLFALIISPAFAATNNFTADDDIPVPGVIFGSGTVSMLIMNGSTAASWKFDSGAFTATNPGSFKVGSSDLSVKSIKIKQGSTDVACKENSQPGTSSVTLPTTAGTYTIVPYNTADCTSLCDSVSNAATLNSFPTCGAATCDSGYTLSGAGANATCVSAGGAVIIPVLNKVKKKSVEDNTSTDKADKKYTETKTSSIAKKLVVYVKNKATLKQIAADAEIAATGDVSKIIKAVNVKRNLAAEINYNKTIVAKIVSGAGIAVKTRNSIANFIVYGTKTTKSLGVGERGGVINSFRISFGKLPENSSDWLDVIKIANGRWPSQSSSKAENRAKINFRIVYLREPNKSNQNDKAAITIMAYGLRPANRNLNSEKAAIKIFKNIYGYSPKKSTAWDVVRAIAYSGAVR